MIMGCRHLLIHSLLFLLMHTLGLVGAMVLQLQQGEAVAPVHVLQPALHQAAAAAAAAGIAACSD